MAGEGTGLKYKRDVVDTLFTRCGQFFTRENFARMPQARRRTDTPQPIFIVGSPRSGTTLIEQMLCSHSNVRAGGELTFLDDIRKISLDLLPDEAGYPENLAQTWTADREYVVSLLRDCYLARAEQYGLLSGGKAFFTDRMPFNEVNLPILKMIFPEARIVHALRHPLDVCVSILSNNMTHGFACGYKMDDIVHHLSAVFALTEHYRTELGIEKLVVTYESLVADPEAAARKLLDYLGLPFEAACARQLHTRSVGRHQHYAQQLKPHAGRLERVMQAFGYR
jgi:hypothetical protein